MNVRACPIHKLSCFPPVVLSNNAMNLKIFGVSGNGSPLLLLLLADFEALWLFKEKKVKRETVTLFRSNKSLIFLCVWCDGSIE